MYVPILKPTIKCTDSEVQYIHKAEIWLHGCIGVCESTQDKTITVAENVLLGSSYRDLIDENLVIINAMYSEY